jgi:hypothetical protein
MAASNIRTAPQQKAKFFSRPEKSKKKKQNDDDPLSWVDDDAIFGFGPDD